MPWESSNELAMGGVPNLRVTWVCSNSEMGSSLVPAHRGDWIILRDLTKFSHSTGAGAPDIHGPPKTHSKDVGGRPVNQVEVEVILQLGCIKNLKRHLGNLPCRFDTWRRILVSVNVEEWRNWIGRVFLHRLIKVAGLVFKDTFAGLHLELLGLAVFAHHRGRCLGREYANWTHCWVGSVSRWEVVERKILVIVFICVEGLAKALGLQKVRVHLLVVVSIGAHTLSSYLLSLAYWQRQRVPESVGWVQLTLSQLGVRTEKMLPLGNCTFFVRKLHLVSIVIQPAGNESISVEIRITASFGLLEGSGLFAWLLSDSHWERGLAGVLEALFSCTLINLVLFGRGLWEVAIHVRSCDWTLFYLREAEPHIAARLDLNRGEHERVRWFLVGLLVAGKNVLVWDVRLLL